MLQSAEGMIINLYELYYDLTAEPVRFTSDSQDVDYEGQAYYAQTIKHSEIAYNTDGSMQDVTLSIGNAERQIQYYIERYDLLHKQVLIKQVYINAAGEVLGHIPASFIIKAVRVTRSQADFTMSMGFDVFRATVPARRIFARFCSLAFRGVDCGYHGAEKLCSKSFADCKRKGNVRNFGGFPGVKSERLYF
jgi:lambda family phage minor tail protein L